jgi:hypothetical protein
VQESLDAVVTLVSIFPNDLVQLSVEWSAR